MVGSKGISPRDLEYLRQAAHEYAGLSKKDGLALIAEVHRLQCKNRDLNRRNQRAYSLFMKGQYALMSMWARRSHDTLRLIARSVGMSDGTAYNQRWREALLDRCRYLAAREEERCPQ